MKNSSPSEAVAVISPMDRTSSRHEGPKGLEGSCGVLRVCEERKGKFNDGNSACTNRIR